MGQARPAAEFLLRYFVDMSDEAGTFDVGAFGAELDGEKNYEVGTRLLLENDRVKVWKIVLKPGESAPFHWHTNTYFYVCAAGGRVRTRFSSCHYVEGDLEP